jgi:homoserine kinase type II
VAVYTHLSDDEIAAFLASYDMGVLVSAKGIAEGIENTNYLLETKSGSATERYILTVYEQRVDVSELPFFMDLTTHLAVRGIPCARAVTARNGKVILPLAGKSAALIYFLEGKGNPDITPAHLSQLGGLCAQMHVAARSFGGSRRNALGLGGWQRLYERFAARADEICEGLSEEIAAELEFLRANWPCDLPAGVVHTDLFPDNVFFDEKAKTPTISGVIDFYFACHDLWAYDLLIAMNAWCFDDQFKFVPARAKALFAAYQQERALTEEECEMLPVLARGAAMRFLVTRCYDWLNRPEGALVNPKDPMEYVAKLRFHQKAKSASDYGVV